MSHQSARLSKLISSHFPCSNGLLQSKNSCVSFHVSRNIGADTKHLYRMSPSNPHWERATERKPRAAPDKFQYWQSFDPTIDEAAAKQSVRLTPSAILYSGKSNDGISHLLRSAQYLHRELPVRLAHRVMAFRSLPYIVGCNPLIFEVQEMYVRAFHVLSGFPKISGFEDEQRYSKALMDLMDDHRDVVSMLAQGFKESLSYMDDEARGKFLDDMLTSRLGIRLLAEHHLALHQERPNYVGLICINMDISKICEKWAIFCQDLCQHHFGIAPEFKISGHLEAAFPYITMPLDYILPELLKNAMKATIKAHPKSLPPVNITVASNKHDFQIRISDRGGGISHEGLTEVTKYHYTSSTERSRLQGLSSNETEFDINDVDPLSDMINLANPSRGPVGGFGFGLPASRAYANYLGGEINLQSLEGLGTDAYLRLKHFDIGARDSFRI